MQVACVTPRLGPLDSTNFSMYVTTDYCGIRNSILTHSGDCCREKMVPQAGMKCDSPNQCYYTVAYSSAVALRVPMTPTSF